MRRLPAAGLAHHLVTRGDADVVSVEVADRSPEDRKSCPEDDIHADRDADGSRMFSLEDGTRS